VRASQTRNLQFDALGVKFDLTDEANMKPFFLLATSMASHGAEAAFLAFLEPPPRAIAEIAIVDHVGFSQEEIPGCIHMWQCVDGTRGRNDPVLKAIAEV